MFHDNLFLSHHYSVTYYNLISIAELERLSTFNFDVLMDKTGI